MQDLGYVMRLKKEKAHFLSLEMAVWKKTGLPVRRTESVTDLHGADYYAVSGRCRKDPRMWKSIPDALNIELAEAIPKILKGIKCRKENHVCAAWIILVKG